MKPVIAIRPEPGCTATVAAGQALGLTMIGHPLWEIVGCDWSPPHADAIDALLIGSANALRFAGPDLARFIDKPVHAVGETTASEARAMGFALGSVGQGGLQQIIDALPRESARLLRLAGAERVPLTIPAHLAVETRVVYEAVPRPVPPALADRLRAGAVVLLHSAAAAQHFASECDRLALPRERIAIAALGPRIAAAAGAGWAACATAAQPRDPALLSLAREMCH